MLFRFRILYVYIVGTDRTVSLALAPYILKIVTCLGHGDSPVLGRYNKQNKTYSYFTLSENTNNFLLCTKIYLSYINLIIQLSQFDKYPTQNTPHRQPEATRRTQSEHIVPVTCQTRQPGTLIYMRDNYVIVLSRIKIAILLHSIRSFVIRIFTRTDSS